MSDWNEDIETVDVELDDFHDALEDFFCGSREKLRSLNFCLKLWYNNCRK